MLSKNVFNLFFVSFFFKLITNDNVFKQILQICVLQITQNNPSHSKLLNIKNIVIWIISEGFSCWSKHAFMWRLQGISEDWFSEVLTTPC